MTDPTTQATRGNFKQVIDDGRGFPIEVDQPADLPDRLFLTWRNEQMPVSTRQMLPLCMAIDDVNGGEYRARIEREQWDRLFASIKDAYAKAVSEPQNKDLYVHKHGLRWAMDELRSQQPSDQTQGEVTT